MIRWISIIGILVIGTIKLWAQTSGKIESIQLFEKEIVLQGEDRKGPYQLPDSLIIQNTDTILLNGRKMTKEEYLFDYINGEIRFNDIISQDTEIKIMYKKMPYALKKKYFHYPVYRRVLGASTDPSDLHLQSLKSPEDEEYGAQLTKSGSITRGVTVGNNRSLKLNSSLNLNVSGKIAENVQVVAALTDQTTPIQPEGTTQNLQEIDKVFIQINAPHLSATMGDFQISLGETEFAQYNRKLQGALGRAEFDNFDVMVSGAVSRGKYYSMTVQSREGYQGPYQLYGDRGQLDIIVLAGTEKVYIDGELMIRGETNDYIIDYSAAQITFTRSRLITSDSRIVVDFQYSDEKFRRNLYSAQSNASLWNGRVELKTTFLHEADDKENPLDFTLTEKYLEVLAKAGDKPDKAIIDDSTHVGKNKGHYILSEDSLHFVYVGKDSGDYEISFSDVGDGLGSYAYKGSGRYEYVGENAGRYAPVLLLPTAKSHSVLDFGLKFSPVSSISLKGEIGLSSEDKNTYSNIDDEDNSGLAQNWELEFSPDTLRLFGLNMGKVNLLAKSRHVNDRFRDIDRTTEVEYNRRWDLPKDAGRGEIVHQFQARFEPGRGMLIGGEYGMIEKGNYFNSDRWQFESRLTDKKRLNYDYRIEQISSKDVSRSQAGHWRRQRGKASYTLGIVKPLVDYEGEVKKENWSDSLYTGFKFDSYTAGLQVSPWKQFLLSGKYSIRDDKDYAGNNLFSDKSEAVTQNYILQLQQVRSFSANLEFTHREKNFADSSSSSTKTDLAEIRMSFNPWKRALDATLNYQISNTATAKKERIYINVSEGDGNYRYDEELNEYVNDPLGNYIMRVLTTDDFVPVIELKTSTRVRLSPSRVWGRFSFKDKKKPLLKKIASAFSSETFIAIDERTQEKNIWDIYLLNMEKFRQPGVTIFGNLQLRQDVYFFEHDKNFSMRVRYNSRDEKNNQFLEGGQDRIEREKSVRLTTRFSTKLSSQSEMTQKRTARLFFYSGRQDRDIYATQAKINMSYRPKTPFEIALESRLSWEEDRVYENPTVLHSYAVVPSMNYSFRSKGRLSVEFEWSYVDSSPHDRVIPYEMADGRSLGSSTRWDIRFDYRFSPTIQATFSYNGRNEPERQRIIHTGRAQVTAAFR
ncbi:hypothetical protein JW935_12205 [candidate division KSB1 bacterium]|nr:hypothetical protein [candidate division KSB1 bacterium]